MQRIKGTSKKLQGILESLAISFKSEWAFNVIKTVSKNESIFFYNIIDCNWTRQKINEK